MGIFKKSNLICEDPLEVTCILKDQDCTIHLHTQQDFTAIDQLSKLIPIKLTNPTVHRVMKNKIIQVLGKNESDVVTKVKKSTVNDIIMEGILINILDGTYTVRCTMFDRFTLDVTFKMIGGSFVKSDNYNDNGPNK